MWPIILLVALLGGSITTAEKISKRDREIQAREELRESGVNYMMGDIVKFR